ncbi:hypothetical protein [Telluribacter sp. SYSU D00476]|uniref:hypothetical protein n=1 Tax=Telluribacter sp. SYSU D00476 TaxID=2811430 RepID=UPI001FF64442|nr:hypothetical protein [Telluribacter sp. SYSU D00476]
MKKSNIFAYVELTKLVGNLGGTPLKDRLKSQAAYFNIIESRLFSDELAKDWEAIVNSVKPVTVPTATGDRVPLSQVAGTIEQMNEKDCQLLATRLKSLHQKLETELNH